VRGFLENLSDISKTTGAALLILDHAAKASPERWKSAPYTEGKNKPVNFYPVGNRTNYFSNNRKNTDINSCNSLPYNDLQVKRLVNLGYFTDKDYQ
jgi:hypothetical protein